MGQVRTNMRARVRLLLQAEARACCPPRARAILEAPATSNCGGGSTAAGRARWRLDTAHTAPACLNELHPALQVGHAAPHILAGVRLVHVPGRVHLL